MFACHKCHKRYKYDKTLKNHLRSHSNGSKITCHVCYKSFLTISNLYKHKRNIHGINSRTDYGCAVPRPSTSKEKREKSTTDLENCNKSFIKKSRKNC